MHGVSTGKKLSMQVNVPPMLTPRRLSSEKYRAVGGSLGNLTVMVVGPLVRTRGEAGLRKSPL
jgi:hypothetical protein